MKRVYGAVLALALSGWSVATAAQQGELKIEVQNIASDLLLTNHESAIDAQPLAHPKR